jgi:hypothetical protein
VVATGTPEAIANNELSHTGQWLGRVLGGHAGAELAHATESEVFQ